LTEPNDELSALQDALDASDEIIVVVDRRFRVRACTRAARRWMTDRNAAGESGGHARLLLRDGAGRSAEALAERAMQRRADQPVGGESALRDAEGAIVAVDGHVRPLLDAQSVVRGAVFQLKLREGATPAIPTRGEALRSLLGALAGALADELGDPLTVLTASLEFQLEALEGLRAQHASAGRDLTGALDELADVAREARMGATRLREELDLLRLVARDESPPAVPCEGARVVADARRILAREGRPIELELDGSPTLRGHPRLLAHAVVHALDIALAALPPQSVSRVQVTRGTGDDGGLRLVMPAREPVELESPRASLARAFGQACFGVCGASLSIVHEEGRLSAVLSIAPGQGSGEVPRSALRTRRRPRVLVIDDEPLVIGSLARILGRDHDVIGESDPKSALARVIAGEAFDAVVCDLSMPGMDGPTFYEALGKHDAGLAARVVFMSGGAWTERAQAFVQTTQQPVLDKPFGGQRLREVLASLIPS
jgi:CheY-like chemotaxis protein